MASIDLEHNDNNWLIIYDSLSRVCTQLRFKTTLQDTFTITETCKEHRTMKALQRKAVKLPVLVVHIKSLT